MAWSDSAAAYASQRWFIVRIRQLVTTLDEALIFVEDDPSVAPAMHCQAMKDAGLLSAEQISQLEALSRSELMALATEGFTWEQIFLDAPDAVLTGRLRQRDGGFPGDQEWLELIAGAFRQAAARVDQEALQTSDRHPRQIAEEAASRPRVR
jgi:hypothetical protein